MINVHISTRGPGRTVIRAHPRAARRRAAGARLDVAAVTLQDDLASIAAVALTDPVWELCAAVAVGAAAVCDGEGCELRLGGRCGWDAGLERDER